MKKLLLSILVLLSMAVSANATTEVTLETKITGLYVAFFNRAADEGGLTYWTNKGNNSSNQSNVLKELAAGFAQHASFDRAYGDLSNQSFVEAVYKNALGREGDTAGINYWTSRLNLSQNDPNYLSRSDFVSVFVEAALTFDRNDTQYAGLSEEDLNGAQFRHDLLANKAEVGLAFTHQLGTLSNVTDNENPESDPAYLASIKIISGVTEDFTTVTMMTDLLYSVRNSVDPIEVINNWGLEGESGIVLAVIIDEEPIPGASIEIYDVNGTLLFQQNYATNNDGKYRINANAQTLNKFVQSKTLSLVVKKNDKVLRGLILDFNTTFNEDNYDLGDTTISDYSEGLMKICDAISLDTNSCKVLAKSFYENYDTNGTYTHSCSFAFDRIIEDIAFNIKENFYQNKVLLNNTQLLEKVATLKEMNLADIQQCQGQVSLPLVKQSNEDLTLNVISFDPLMSDFNNTDLSLEYNVSLNSNSPFYDKAIGFTFTFSNPNTILRNVNIDTYLIQNNSHDILYAQETFTVIKNQKKTSLIENFKLEFNIEKNENIQNNTRALYRAAETEVETDKYASSVEYNADGTVIATFTIDATNINQGFNKYDMKLVAEIADTGATLSDGWTNIVTASKTIEEFEIEDGEINTFTFDITSMFSDVRLKDKHQPVKFTFYDVDFLNPDDELVMANFYAFVDWNNDYKNATIASLSLSETILNKDSLHGDNVFENKNGEEKKHLRDLATHRIIDFDLLVFKDFSDRTKEWRASDYVTQHHYAGSVSDTRTPLLLIHGWQGGIGDSNPSLLLQYHHNEFEYWHNFISYYLATPELYEKYKLYTYHYPSYKHITYNARMLEKLLNEVKQKNTTTLARGLNGEGIVLMGHSMGGLISRSLIEEHKGLGNNAEKLIKLITLDTPHHGSPSVVTSYFRTLIANYGVAGFLKAKDLDTPGAVDLMWDNYDLHFSCGGDKLGTLECSHLVASTVNSGVSRNFRLDDASFDYYYNQLNNTGTSELDKKMNPWLLHMNNEYSENIANGEDSIAQKKYIYYVAHTANVVASQKYSGGDKQSINNPILNDNVMWQNTLLINNIGYASGGAEPVCSAFLSNATTANGITRFYEGYMNPSKFITIDNHGDSTNNFVPYRMFWDYEHETIMNGVYKEKGDWDTYIDKEFFDSNYPREVDITKFSGYINDGGTYYDLSAKGAYYDTAKQYLNKKTNLVTTLYFEPVYMTANPLKTEPVFMVLQRDLRDAISEGDFDGDGLPDEFEDENNLEQNNPSDADEDMDRDGLTNLQEYEYGTDLNNSDTDGDGYADGYEITLETDPNDSNSFLDITPQNVAVSMQDVNATFTWDNVTDVTEYKLYLAPTTNNLSAEEVMGYNNILENITSPYLLSNIELGSYSAVLSSVKNGIESEPSEILEFLVTVATQVSNSKPTALTTITPRTVLEGEVIIFDASASIDVDGSIVEYEWKEGETVLSKQMIFTKSDFLTGEHHITLTVTDNDGGTDNDVVVINVFSMEESSRTALGYIRTHPDEKLVSSDCSAYIGGGQTVSLEWVTTLEGENVLITPIIEGVNSWRDVSRALGYDLSPSSNMMRSIDGCISVTDGLALGYNDDIILQSVVRGLNKEESPFSDIWDTTVDQTGTTPPAESDVYIDLYNGETGLIWQDDERTKNLYTWQEASDLCATLNQENFSGHNDWRLPTIVESNSLGHAYNDYYNDIKLTNYIRDDYWLNIEPGQYYGYTFDYYYGTDSVHYGDTAYSRCVRGSLIN